MQLCMIFQNHMPIAIFYGIIVFGGYAYEM